MNKPGWIGGVLLAALPWSAAAAGVVLDRPPNLDRLNDSLHGKVVDYTDNHGRDNRIWSRALHERRSMYVYLPPGYDPNLQYPLMLWLHGFWQDEKSFASLLAPRLDEAMHEGKLPPFIVAAPSGKLSGKHALFQAGSFFLNSTAGDYEDYLLHDVWDFVVTHYPIRPERGAHILAGVSMGGFAAFNQGIKHRDSFGIVVGVFPPVNLRWVNCAGRYFANFNPKDWGWRTRVDHGQEVVARFYGGLISIRLRQVIDPLFGTGQGALWEVARENPIEMLSRFNVRPGDLEMYIAYAGKDEFNIDAQVESFLYLARCRGLAVGVGYDPHGHHNARTAFRLFPGIVAWLGPRVAPFSPQPGADCGPECAPAH